MGLKRKLNTAVKAVTHTEEEQKYIEEHDVQGVKIGKALPTSELLEVQDTEEPEKNGADYIPLEVKGSNGKTYKIVIPRSYYKTVPKTWSWNEQRYKVAEDLAAGFPLTEIATRQGTHRSTIYGWLQHPEFKEHVDGLTLESGWANQRERIAGLNKVTKLLFEKVVNEIDKVKLTDKSIGAVLSSLQMIAKQISQEKGEFIEQSKVDQQTNITGTMAVAELKLDTIMNGKTSEEKAALEAEFNQLGDDIIRSITGEKD